MENLNLKKACPSHFPCLTLKTLHCRDLATCKWIGVYACAGGGGEGRRCRGLCVVHSAFSDFELLQSDKHLSENITKY